MQPVIKEEDYKMKKKYYVEIARNNQWFNSRILSPKNGLMEDPWCLELHLFESLEEANREAEKERCAWIDSHEVSFKIVEYIEEKN